MTAGTVVITGGILATVILLCIIAVLCYCRLQYYCCKKDDSDDEEEEEGHHLSAPSRFSTCNSCNSQVLDGQGDLALPSEPPDQHRGAQSHCPSCAPYSSPFYIRTADMVPNGGERLTYTPTCYKELGPPPLKMSSLQSFPVTRAGLGREAFTNPRAISTEV